MDLEQRLFELHNNLNFTNKYYLKQEIPEQLMVLKHIKPTDVVLEFGGSVGRNSCIISKILNDSNNLVTIEPNSNERLSLEQNRQLNNFHFKIEPNVLSNIPLYSIGWRTYKNIVHDSTFVNNISWETLLNKYNLNFNVFIIDNEGNFVDNLKTFPTMLENINLLSIEHDFNSEYDLNYFINTMNKNGFRMIDKYMKNDKYGPGINWGDGVQTDPIFVSVWKK
jgi:hypothetical protein